MNAVAKEQIQSALDDMYDAFQHRDWVRFNVHLDPSVTAWESHLPDMIRGTSELDAHRASRASPPSLSSFGATDLVVDAWGDTALARYLLVGIDAETAAERRSRVTEAFRWNGTRWRIVHRHSERLAPVPST
ncbi:nuclear transport factor 2 family protein [Rhodococcoides yunnanense]|uniref:nuclear transport factor 2 family protein n=1 Tax=Rhodococcoides yunnanense TaxID=278209 RepID=UPI0009324487|nr:nuclear transport factor 2 family protein [Rhodococcus yunnanensis]